MEIKFDPRHRFLGGIQANRVQIRNETASNAPIPYERPESDCLAMDKM